METEKFMVVFTIKAKYHFHCLFGSCIDAMLKHPSLSLLDLMVSFELFVENASQCFSKKDAANKVVAPVAYVIIW